MGRESSSQGVTCDLGTEGRAAAGPRLPGQPELVHRAATRTRRLPLSFTHQRLPWPVLAETSSSPGM